MSMQNNLQLSIISPVLNEELCIEAFLNQVIFECNSLQIPYEIILVDDGSSDNTITIIKKMITVHSNIKLLELAYNHGKYAALYAGMQAASGLYQIYMDPDLQDPPHEIINLYNSIKKENVDIVFGTNAHTHSKQSFLNYLFSKTFWYCLIKFSHIPFPKNMVVMRIFTKEISEKYISYCRPHWFAEANFLSLSKNYKTLEIAQNNRFAGTSKFNFSRKMKYTIWAFWCSGVLNASRLKNVYFVFLLCTFLVAIILYKINVLIALAFVILACIGLLVSARFVFKQIQYLNKDFKIEIKN